MDKQLIGARASHSWADLDGRRYIAFGTNKILYVYDGDDYHDITPFNPSLAKTGCDITTTNGSRTVTITTPRTTASNQVTYLHLKMLDHLQLDKLHIQQQTLMMYYLKFN